MEVLAFQYLGKLKQMFWKGKVGWQTGEGLSSSDSCIEEKAEVGGWIDGWQNEEVKVTRMKPLREACSA